MLSTLSVEDVCSAGVLVRIKGKLDDLKQTMTTRTAMLCTNIPPTYNLNGVQLLNVKEFRDLGIIVDADCLFKQHISHICRKAYFSINVIVRCFHTANIAALIISYKSSVRPMLEYSSTV